MLRDLPPISIGLGEICLLNSQTGQKSIQPHRLSPQQSDLTLRPHVGNLLLRGGLHLNLRQDLMPAHVPLTAKVIPLNPTPLITQTRLNLVPPPDPINQAATTRLMVSVRHGQLQILAV